MRQATAKEPRHLMIFRWNRHEASVENACIKGTKDEPDDEISECARAGYAEFTTNEIKKIS